MTVRRPLRPASRVSPRDAPEVASPAERFLLFEVAGQAFAITAPFLREVALPDGLASPGNPGGGECVTFVHRAASIPALDLRVLFGYPDAPRTGATRVLVCERDGKRLGLVVERVGDMVEVGPEAILSVPEGASRLPAACFRGVLPRGQRVILVLEASGLAGLECVRRFGDGVAVPCGGAA